MTKAKTSNIDKVAVTGAVLADLLGTSKMTITRMERAAVIARNGDNLFRLKDSLRAIYHQREQGEYQSQMERDAAEKLHWQAMNEKAKNLAWREEYGMKLAEGYRDSLAFVFDSVREFYERRGDVEGSDFMESVAMKVRSGDLYSVVAGASDMEECDNG